MSITYLGDPSQPLVISSSKKIVKKNAKVDTHSMRALRTNPAAPPKTADRHFSCELKSLILTSLVLSIKFCPLVKKSPGGGIGRHASFRY